MEEVLSYAMANRIRFEVLTLLNEGVFAPIEIAEILDEPIGKLSHHIKELANAGSIEVARVEPAGNALKHYYRAVEQPYVSDEEALAMTPQQRQVIAGVTLQSIMAESMSSFWAGTMSDDPRNTVLIWRWINVDREGHREIMDELLESWSRIRGIEARSTARRCESGEAAESVIVAMQGFRRSRFSPKPPAPLVNPE